MNELKPSPAIPLKLWAGILESQEAPEPRLWVALVSQNKIVSGQAMEFRLENLETTLATLTQYVWDSLGPRSLEQHLGREPLPKIVARLTWDERINSLRAFDGQKFLCVPGTIKSIESNALRNWLGSPSAFEFQLKALPLSTGLQPKPKLLVHVCCGPDAAGVINQLKEDFEIEMFWYDPNIQPKEEHDKRLEAFEKVCKLTQTPYTVGEYDVENFETAIKGLEWTPEQGAKCSQCYDMRLDRAAREARDRGFEAYTTTLAISPHKVQKKLEAFGALNEKKYGVPYYARNFMKHEGFKDSVEFTRKHEIFRQDYCGCFYSLHEGGKNAQRMAHELGFLKPAQG